MRPTCNPNESWTCATPNRHDGLLPTAWPVADDVLLTLLASGRQLKLNLCDERLEEPDKIQARTTPWSGLDPPKPEASAGIARLKIHTQSSLRDIADESDGNQPQHPCAKLSCSRPQERPQHRPAYSGALPSAHLTPQDTLGTEE